MTSDCAPISGVGGPNQFQGYGGPPLFASRTLIRSTVAAGIPILNHGYHDRIGGQCPAGTAMQGAQFRCIAAEWQRLSELRVRVGRRQDVYNNFGSINHGWQDQWIDPYCPSGSNPLSYPDPQMTVRWQQ